MCTVVVRWASGQPVRILALRDELTSRAFDEPDAWWPECPGVIGGRDRSAGGTWCATRVSTGVTALVLNRPQKREADVGAPSRGILPLLAVMHGEEWVSQLDPTGMASFALVLAAPEQLSCWFFDGQRLAREDFAPGVHMVTSGGAEDGKAEKYLAEFTEASFPEGWRGIVESTGPQSDPTALVVRHEFPEFVFATVFGELIDARPGQLRLDYSRQPWLAEPWVTRAFT